MSWASRRGGMCFVQVKDRLCSLMAELNVSGAESVHEWV